MLTLRAFRLPPPVLGDRPRWYEEGVEAVGYWSLVAGFWSEGSFEGPLEVPWGRLGAPWGSLGAPWVVPRSLLGLPWGALGGMRFVRAGSYMTDMGPSWSHQGGLGCVLGELWGSLGGPLGLLWAPKGAQGTPKGRPRSPTGAPEASSQPCRFHVGSTVVTRGSFAGCQYH